MNSTMELVMPGAEFCFDVYYDGILQNPSSRLALLTFTYPKEEKDKWRAVLCAMFSTIEEGTKET